MSTQTLRDLAKSYAKGTIGKDSYRKLRTNLIKNIVDGKVTVKDINYEGPLRPPSDVEEAITEGIVRDKTEITGPRSSSASNIQQKSPTPAAKQSTVTVKRKKSSLIFILISATIVILLILAVILFYPKPPESIQIETQDTSENTISTATSTDEANTTDDSTDTIAAETLLGTFLSEKNWSEDNIDKFLEAWSELTAEEKSSVVETKRMQRMKSSIYKQFTEAKALASINSEKARMKQQKLIDFAATLGIDDSRLVLD